MKIILKVLCCLTLVSVVSSCDFRYLDPETLNNIEELHFPDENSNEGEEPLTEEEILAQTLNLPTANFNYANPNLPRHLTNGNVP
ncbi:MAG: hypothetical protein AAF242_17315 [Bacteroidota bacterium]